MRYARFLYATCVGLFREFVCVRERYDRLTDQVQTTLSERDATWKRESRVLNPLQQLEVVGGLVGR